MIATAVITAPRPRATLTQSLASYRAAGFTAGVLLCVDGGPLADVPYGCSVINNPTPLGNLRNWHSALKALVITTKAEWVMVCEDDIDWARNAAPKLHEELPKIAQEYKAGGYSLFLPRRMSKRGEREFADGMLTEGWHWKHMQVGKSMWGAQCLLFTRAQAERVLRGLVPYIADQRRQKNVDAWVSEIINGNDERIYWRVPALVDHKLGDGNSSLYSGDKLDRPNLQSHYFTGEA